MIIFKNTHFYGGVAVITSFFAATIFVPVSAVRVSNSYEKKRANWSKSGDRKTLPVAKSCPPPVSVNKLQLEHSHMTPFMYCLAVFTETLWPPKSDYSLDH